VPSRARADSAISAGPAGEDTGTYEARIREVEHGTFTPLVFSATGGMADQAIVFINV